MLFSHLPSFITGSKDRLFRVGAGSLEMPAIWGESRQMLPPSNWPQVLSICSSNKCPDEDWPKKLAQRLQLVRINQFSFNLFPPSLSLPLRSFFRHFFWISPDSWNVNTTDSETHRVSASLLWALGIAKVFLHSPPNQSYLCCTCKDFFFLSV